MRRSTEAASHPTAMTLEQWSNLEEDVEGELVDGFLEEEEMPSFLHELVVSWLIRALYDWARRRGGWVAGSETKIAVGPRRGRKPDVSVYLKGGRPPLHETLVRAAPHLVIEVTSPRPRDVRRDRIDKLADYARVRIPYYWILDPQLRSFEIFELAPSRRYSVARATGGGRVRVPGCPGLTLDLDALWAELDRAERDDERAEGKRGSRQ
jgi:Uma2 family endonuclease